MSNKKTGIQGETYAKEYLINKGYKIICNNYSCRLGEIDIIAQYRNYIIFVEVKYRKNLSFGYPREAVNVTKQNKIRNVANMYISTKNIVNSDFRFDVVEVLNNKNEIIIEHIHNAF